MAISATTRSSVSRTYPSSRDDSGDESRPQFARGALDSRICAAQFLHDGFPCVSGMLCGGPLPTRSWISTDVAEIRTTL